jgi:hypothetical protein
MLAQNPRALQLDPTQRVQSKEDKDRHWQGGEQIRSGVGSNIETPGSRLVLRKGVAGSLVYPSRAFWRIGIP